MQIKRIVSMLKTGEFFYKVTNRIIFRNIKNNAIKNSFMQYREYLRIKKKYIDVLNKEIPKFEQKASNYVWILWFQGENNAPELIKKCINSTKSAFKEQEVVVLDANNYKEYVEFPEYIEEKFKAGIISYAHFSDLIRLQLLIKYGGIWCDATLYFTGQVPEHIKNANLFAFKNITLDKADDNAIAASSWFMVSKSNNDILLATRNMLFEYWKKEKYLREYLELHLFFKMATEKYCDTWEEIPTYSNVNPHILQFELMKQYSEERFKQIKDISFVHKLTRHIDCEKSGRKTMLDHIIEDKLDN